MEFSTTKITPNDNVKIPSMNGNNAGYMETDELKEYVGDGLITQSITDGDTTHSPSGDAVNGALNAISTISPISDLSTYVTDTYISSVHNFNAYKTANIISIMIDVTISDTALHTIAVPTTVLPSPKNSIMAMASVDYGSDSTTSEYGVIYGAGGNTNIRLRVHTNGGRIMASVTYLY